MLELKEIKKDYLAGENTVHALKGISLKFRKSELVSILGPSGCGKTTMLNIIGGLDHYTEGDLVINGRSTKDFKDRDWDAYRNHSIGFVFQSYNLIPHQSVLQNVELALTLSGVKKAERKARAIKALEDVGLGDQIKKRPSELSGGQMQRVAIARALVNDPDIILADEPTGALDTETSVQVMDILKKVSEDRLVIMVTHNPDLANKYSTRIVRMLDGKITDDSMPLTDEEVKVETAADNKAIEERNSKKKKEKKPSMSFATSFGLSFKNLFTKKGRTILTSFAGSIGIIGIALIYAISNGFSGYINEVQEDTLSSYPLTIEQNHTDLSSLMKTFMNINNGKRNHEDDAVYKRSSVYEIINAFATSNQKENDLKSFKSYLDKELEDKDSKLSKATNGIQYSYNLKPLVYTKNVDGEIIRSDADEVMNNLISEYMGVDMSTMSSYSSSGMMSMGTSSTPLWQEMLSGEDGEVINPLIKKQYDVIYGEWPKEYNEVVLVVDENNELNDMALYSLGLESETDMAKIMNAAMNATSIENDGKQSWTYQEICSRDYRVVFNSDCYSYDELTGLYTDMRENETGLSYLYDNGINLKVTGIIKPSEDATSAMLTGAIAYTKGLTEFIIEKNGDSEVIQAQLDNPEKDVITGLPFKATTEQTDADKAQALKTYINSLTDTEKIMMYTKIVSIPKDEELQAMLDASMTGVTVDIMKQTLTQAFTQQMNMDATQVEQYLASMTDEQITEYYTQAVTEQIKQQYAAQVMAGMEQMTPEASLAALDTLLNETSEAQLASYYDQVIEFSSSSYDDNLNKMGYVQLDSPSMINLFAASFEDKDVIEGVIADYNKGKKDDDQIKYTDYIGLMMSSITTIINAITYVLIAFVSISLIVSSIMIGVITLISVQERTKEIGILRAIGASKKNVSNMFNAETVLIGFTSGLMGVLITVLLCIPINMIIHHLTDINELSASLPFVVGVVLVLISMFLTLIAGIIPSRSAAKKDPVVALRTE